MVFPRRIPEPQTMKHAEFAAFSCLSNKHHQKWMVPMIDDAIERTLPPICSVLDVACGPGFTARELASRSPIFQVTGLDISPDALFLARKNDSKRKNIRYVRGSVEQMPFRDARFDLVICKDSFHHFGNPQKALKEMLRVLRKNGTLYLQDMRRDLPDYLLARATPPDTTLKKLQYYSTRASYTKHEIRNFLNRTSFISRYVVSTRLLNQGVRRRYSDIPAQELKESFQARYRAIIYKA